MEAEKLYCGVGGTYCLFKLRQMWTQRTHMKWVLPWLVLFLGFLCIFVLRWPLKSAQYKIFFSSPYTISILLAISPSKLGRQSCRVTCLFKCVSVILAIPAMTVWYSFWSNPKLGERSIWSIFRSQFDLPPVSADKIGPFQFHIFDPNRFIHRSSFLVLSSGFGMGRLHWSV